MAPGLPVWQTQNYPWLLRFSRRIISIELFESGSPTDAKLIKDLVKEQKVRCDFSWGLDHASWAVLKHLYPNADIPVIEMSLSYSPFNGWHQPNLRSFYDLAKQLTHFESGKFNNRQRQYCAQPAFGGHGKIDGEPYDWAIEFDSRAKRDLVEGDHKDLLNCENIDRRCHFLYQLSIITCLW